MNNFELGKLMDKHLNEFMMNEVTTSAIAHEPSNISLDKMVQIATEFQRENFFYVMAVDWIPENAHGILYVRKEDMHKWKIKQEGER